MLRDVLSTPWRLFLAITLTESGHAPTEFVEYVSDESDLAKRQKLIEKLLSGFSAAAVQLTERRRRYTPAKVETWLRGIGSSLDNGREPRSREYLAFGVSGSEMVPHMMWLVAGRRLVATLHVALTTIAALTFGFALYLVVDALPLISFTMSALFYATNFVAAMMIATCSRLSLFTTRLYMAELIVRLGGVSTPEAVEQHRQRVRDSALVLRWFPPNAPLRSPVAALVGFCAVLPLALLFLASRFQGTEGATLAKAVLGVGQLIAFTAAMTGLHSLLTGATAWRHNALPGFENPRLTSSQVALRAELRSGVAFGIGIGTVPAAAALVADAQISRVTWGLFLTASIALGVAMVARMSTRYALGRIVGALSGQLPWQLATFLGWACRAGLLRQAGVAYQFRHLEFQEWVMQH